MALTQGGACRAAGRESADEASSSDEDAVARRVMTDRHRPAFGEQAAAPLQVPLPLLAPARRRRRRSSLALQLGVRASSVAGVL